MAELKQIVQTWVDEDGTTTRKTFDYEGGKLVGSNSVGVAVEAAVDDSTATPLKGKLPASFPHNKALAKAGVNTFAQLAKHESDYTAIPGIGAASASDIAEWLASPPVEGE